MSVERKPGGLAGGLITALGVIFALIGLTLTIGGGWLIGLGGSWYYLLAGLGLLASGGLLIWRNRLGAFIYIGVFVLTVLWALWEVGIDGWGLVPRVIAPAVLLAFVLAALPALWPERGKVWAAGGAVGLLALLMIGGVASANAARIKVQSDLPAAQAVASSDPDALPVGADWPAYGGTYSAQRFSPLTQITPRTSGGCNAPGSSHTRPAAAHRRTKLRRRERRR
jgi:quinoprotein glucose dehydrogenase